MPTYEFACKKCGENLEVFRSFNARPLTKHSGCGGELQKIFHARGVVFKGSGFYKTDSRVPAGDGNGKVDAPKKDAKQSEGKSKSSSDKSSTSTTSKSD